MNQCETCQYKKDDCYCPPDKTCTAYRKEIKFVFYTYTFLTTDDWEPDTSGCWYNCPLRVLIRLGESCPCRNDDTCKCPFKFPEVLKRKEN